MSCHRRARRKSRMTIAFFFAAAIFNSRRVAEAGDSHGSCNASFVELCAVQFREPND